MKYFRKLTKISGETSRRTGCERRTFVQRCSNSTISPTFTQFVRDGFRSSFTAKHEGWLEKKLKTLTVEWISQKREDEIWIFQQSKPNLEIESRGKARKFNRKRRKIGETTRIRKVQGISPFSSTDFSIISAFRVLILLNFSIFRHRFWIVIPSAWTVSMTMSPCSLLRELPDKSRSTILQMKSSGSPVGAIHSNSTVSGKMTDDEVTKWHRVRDDAMQTGRLASGRRW